MKNDLHIITTSDGKEQKFATERDARAWALIFLIGQDVDALLETGEVQSSTTGYTWQYRTEARKTTFGSDVTAEDGYKFGGFVKQSTDKIFRVEGWGEVGLANLAKFIPNPGEKSQYDLEVGERSEGTTPDGPERITRTQ